MSQKQASPQRGAGRGQVECILKKGTPPSKLSVKSDVFGPPIEIWKCKELARYFLWNLLKSSIKCKVKFFSNSKILMIFFSIKLFKLFQTIKIIFLEKKSIPRIDQLFFNWIVITI
jgi:hypothetical protein